MAGLFITFEGGEGSGKTSQIQLLYHALHAEFPQLEIIRTREPGGTSPAEEIRSILVNGDKDKITPQTEALLMIAARTENVDKIIRPAKQRNAIILCDRFADSSRVYQALAHHRDFDEIDWLHQFGFQNMQPDLTFYLDVEPQVGLARAEKRVSENSHKNQSDEDRFEGKGLAFHHAVRDGFLKLAAQFKERFYVIDAHQSETQISAEILDITRQYLKKYITKDC